MLHAYLVGFFTYYCRKHKTLIINNLDFVISFDAENRLTVQSISYESRGTNVV